MIAYGSERRPAVQPPSGSAGKRDREAPDRSRYLREISSAYPTGQKSKNHP